MRSPLSQIDSDCLENACVAPFAPNSLFRTQEEDFLEVLQPYLKFPNRIYSTQQGVAIAGFPYSSSMLANAYFFSRSHYLNCYMQTENSIPEFRERWQSVLDRLGDLSDKVVVDIGCGPGNLNATLKAEAKVLIGVDISWNALLQARTYGYLPLLADAQNIPLKSRCADVVVLNAALHHCDDMRLVLAEAARLLRPGGYLITDMDPQKGACQYRGVGRLLYHLRFLRMFYRKLIGASDYISLEQLRWRLETETHKRHPGDGLTPKLYEDVLLNLGFTYNLYPHNHYVGAEIFHGDRGKAPLAVRLGQRLSGIDPNSEGAALSFMCVAQRIS